MEIRSWAGTDIGRKRSNNEDNYLVDESLQLYVVADGMGGHASGEIASALAVHTVRDVLAADRDLLESYDDSNPASHMEVCTLLEYAVHTACENIYCKAQREPEKKGMGTTLVVLLFIGQRGFIAYVGDSRIYLLRGGIVYQLTEDHSLMNELVRRGKVRADEFADSPYANFKNAMTRAVGVYENVEVDTLDFDVVAGDSYLLCSDGLYDYTDDAELARLLALPDIREVPGKLIELANGRGGKDNITAVVVQLPDDEGGGGGAAAANLTLNTLRELPLFSDLSYQQLVRIMNLARTVPMDEGQVIFDVGEAADSLYVVLQGEVQLTRKEEALATLDAGAHFGEMALMDDSPRSATVTCTEGGNLLAIDRNDFFEVMHKEPQLAVKLLWSFVGSLVERLRQTTDDLTEARGMMDDLEDFTGDLLE